MLQYHTVAEWTINVPGCLELRHIICTTTSDGLTVTPEGMNDLCPAGVMVHLSVVSVSPFVSNLTTSTALDGTVINCGDNQGRSPDVRITITGKPLIRNDEGSLCRQLVHKKLILLMFQLDALILLKAR